MKYERTKIDGSVFGEAFSSCEFSMLPELPMIELKANKWTVKITDIRYLNEMAVNVFEKCVEVASTEEGVEEAVFNIESLNDDEVRLIIDICMSIKYEAKKGRNKIGGTLLIIGSKRTKEKLILEFREDVAQAIYEYAQMHKNDDGTVHISLVEIVVAMAEKRN